MAESWNAGEKFFAEKHSDYPYLLDCDIRTGTLNRALLSFLYVARSPTAKDV